MSFSDWPRPNDVALPLFSVVVPAYNTAQFIGEAIESVLAQTFKDYEIIVINDGSPDTAELERELMPYYSRVTYIKADHKGPAAARNTGIVKAGAKYIAFLDSDDAWFPWHLAEMADEITRAPALDLIYADAVYFGGSEFDGQTCMRFNPSRGEATFEALIGERCSIISSTVVARRQMIIDVGLFDEALMFGEDFDLWLRIAYGKGRISYLHNPHSERRIHADNLTGDAAKSFAGQAEVLEKFMRKFPLPSSLKRKVRLEIKRCRASVALERGKQNLIDRQYVTAWEELRLANRFFRRPKLYLVLFLLRPAPAVLRYLYGRRARVEQIIR